MQQLGALRRTEQGALALRGDDWRGGVLLIRFEEEEEEEEEEVSVCFRVCVCVCVCVSLAAACFYVRMLLMR